jgi:opacity protein-like surface antigen
MLRSVGAPFRAVAYVSCVLGVSGFAASLPSNAQGVDRKAFYVGLHGGINVPRATVSEFDSGGLPGGVGFITAEAENGYRVGGAVGYIFNRYLRGEVELSYTRNSLDTLDAITFAFPAGTGPLPARGSATTLSGMVNGYVSLPMDKLRPYVGAGIGYARVSSNGAGFVGVPGETDDTATAFSWQLMAGLGYQLTPNLELGGRYRFQHVNGYELYNSAGDQQRIRESEGHSFELTLTWTF